MSVSASPRSTPPWLALGREAAWTRLRALRLGRLVVLATATVLVMLAWCLGHAVLTAEPLHPAASLRWSLGHAAGLAALGSAAPALRDRSLGLRWAGSWLAGLAASDAVARLAGLALGLEAGLHGYATVSLYLALAGLAALVLVPPVAASLIELDFGRSRRAVRAQHIVAVHGARNYAEVELVDSPTPGLARMTLDELERRFPALLVRTHRSHLVNPRRIVAVRRATRGALVLTMSTGSEVPASAKHAGAVLAVHDGMLGTSEGELSAP